ncbi:Rpa49 subunit specific to nuclear RNA polymerase I [Phellopilus nigrolimitatus]|nr:Rpa49 subunit specific to nuclear RNA polymerase I [Phellopilus nigrolimitatus]
MASIASAKKRKRDEVDDVQLGSEQVTLAVHDKDISAVGPVLASFPALHPPKATPFSVYSKRDSTPKDNEQEFASRPILVAGETDSIEFYSTTEGFNASQGSRYLIGVRNKRTNVMTLRPAPMEILARRVKALKDLAPAAATNLTERIEQRNMLGETFGTRKAQKAIRAAERNKVDVSAMEGVSGHIQDSIDANTKSLPTQEEAKTIAESNRNIPPHDINATTPEDVYKLHDIIPEAEFHAIPVTNILAAKTTEERMSHVPYKRSEWIRQHLTSIFSVPKPNKKQIKIILYIACLFAFRIGAPKLVNNREELQQRLWGIPTIVLDGILSRFSETLRGSTEAKFTTDNQVTLMTHMFALCLHVDNFASDPTLIAADLSEPVSRINQHFKLLGCKVEKLNASEISRLGLSAASADHKRAVLRIPLAFPKVRTKRK